MARATPKELKILHVIDSLEPGGAERMLVTAANIFRRRGHQVDVLLIVRSGSLASELDSGIKVHVLGRKNRLNPANMYRLSRIAASYELLHVHLHYNAVYCFLSKLLFPFRAPVILHEHLGEVEKRKISSLLKLTLKNSFFIGVSNHICQWAINIAKLPADRVFLLPNTIIRKKLSSASAKTSPSSQRVKMIIVSNILRNKQIHFAITLLKELQKTTKAELHIYGRKSDMAYYAELQSQIQSLSLADDVSFIHDCTDIQEILPGYDLALHTALSESGPLVLIEYLCRGLPFLSYRTGEVTEQLKNDLPEFVMENFEPAQWTERIKILLAEDADRISRKMEHAFEAHYAEETYYNKCLTIYQRILNS